MKKGPTENSNTTQYHHNGKIGCDTGPKKLPAVNKVGTQAVSMQGVNRKYAGVYRVTNTRY